MRVALPYLSLYLNLFHVHAVFVLDVNLLNELLILECFHFRVYVAHAQREAALVLDPAHCFLRLLKLVRSSLFVIFVHLRARLFLLALLKSLELRGALGGLKNP